jgi:microsomal dipeptidase-like Zn-dependent dipeptidase
MKKGMLVDIAHLDPKGTGEVFEIARRNNFAPIFLSHTYFADLMPPLYADWNKHVTRHQVSQIKQTGGMVGLRTGPDEQLTYRPAGIENNCHGSSRSFAQRHAYATLGLGVNVGLASDQNGLIENAGPRFAGNLDSCMWAYHECKYTAEKKKLGIITYGRADCDLSVWEDEGKLQQAAQGGAMREGLGNDFDTIGFARTDHLDDLLADIRKLGADTSNIENSSENFIRMWERARSSGRRKLDGDVSIPANAIEPYRDKQARRDWIKTEKEAQNCKTDQDCGPGNFCDTGTLTVGRNVCKRKLNDGQLCTTGRACASGTCDVRCIRPNSQPMGGSCYVNAECREGKCSAALFGTINGKCVCDSNADCSSSQYCYKGFADIGTNECRARKADGQSCTSADQCGGGACRAATCYTPGSKAFGQSCNFNAECRQGTCSAELLGLVNGSCVCNEDSHCGAGNYCNKGVAGIGSNDCRPKLNKGQLCTKDHQCKSNRCSITCKD